MGRRQRWPISLLQEDKMTETAVKTRNETALKNDPRLNIPEPPMFRVIFVNDEITTMEFIIEVLKNIFHYDEDRAQVLTIKIHEEGSGVVAVYPFEIAEQKGIETTVLARNNGFPLQVKLEMDQ
jgi:ATP-dependent Clp protease adaptor protein ClpS